MTGQPAVALLLPGQGAQHPGMAVELYGREETFTAAMDEFFGQLGAEGEQLRQDWLSVRPAVPLDDASRAQPLLFAIGCALGRAVLNRGVRPRALLGHSVGELAAAALAGVYPPDAGARIMSARSRAMATTPAGGMLAVAAPADQLAPFSGPADQPSAVVIAAVNAPAQTVLSGPAESLAGVSRRLTAAGITVRPVAARQPFHSPALRAAADQFAAAFAAEPLAGPRIKIWSTRTARPVTQRQALDPGFWAGQLAAPVLFWPALCGMLNSGPHTLVEAGPGQGLTVLARRHRAVRRGDAAVVPLLPATPAGTWAHWTEAVDRLTA